MFARKIAVAKTAQRGDDFMVIARLESLIVSAGLDDAIRRAQVYCEAGADALLIHSRARTADEVAEFATAVRAAGITVPLFMIPTTYPGVSARQLRACGADAVVYANQVIRAALKAMTAVLDHVAHQDSTRLIESDIASVADLFDLVKTDELLDDSPWTGLPEKAGSRA